MSDLNRYIQTAQDFTAPPTGIPATDHSDQVSIAREFANRAASRPEAPPPPPPMAPIVPVAN